IIHFNCFPFVLLRYNLTYGGTAYYKGLSFPDSICKFSPISVVEDTYDTRTVGFFGQEIGRSLGARLDLDGNFCLSTKLNMMTPRFRFPPDEARARNLWQFSPCSISYFKEYIGELQTNCLVDSYGNQYPENLHEYLRELPGDTYGADQQCRLTNGQNSYVCRDLIMDYSTICRGMPCFVPETGSCALLLPADGTLCGNHSKCNQGVCEADVTAPAAV
ncbi:A disintegrin and metalloproteinase with thrombospondin motifs 16-like, partial [Mizuhopecten yessoensis]|uniref:A disintegrin and metalloproteinase with thrombospondin motifs 16-like n=1 Tax=Mizuhopecten yessoensis TaxID=6573 RepID=UPI000B45F206